MSTASASSEPPEWRAGTICLVANDFDGIVRNGGIGTYFYLAALVLARHGWTVHVLYTAPVEDAEAKARVMAELRAAGVTFHSLGDFADPHDESAATFTTVWYLRQADHVAHALGQLHRVYRFDLIEFAEWQGLGFRAVQAKRCGLAFGDVGLVVRAHSCSQWQRDGNHQWARSEEEIQLDYCERYAFEHADFQLSPSAHMLDYLRGVGWRVRDDAVVSFYPFPKPLTVAGPAAGGPVELVFFGRLEVRKGLEIFLDALQQVPPAVPVAFLGKDTHLPSGETATDAIRRLTAGRKVTVRTDLNREQALTYVATGNRVAVLPSLLDNLPFTVIECLRNRVPFVSSAVGGIPELIPDPAARAAVLFEPTAKDLARCLTGLLALDHAGRAKAMAAAWDAPFLQTNDAQVGACYAQLLAAAVARRAAAADPAGPPPVVTVAVPYYNLPEYLPETLASLAAQTYRHLEVIVVDDGSPDPAAAAAFEAAARRYPEFRFVRQLNAGPGAARNRALAEASGEYFVPVDADNIADPRMVETFVAAIRRRPDVAGLTCYFRAFRQTADIAAGRTVYHFRPTGGPHFLGAVRNVYGDTNAILRVDALRAIGGYVTERRTPYEDWETHAKLVAAGHRLDVIPAVLFHYRHRDDSRHRTENAWKGHRRVLDRFAAATAGMPQADAIGLWTLLVSVVKLTHHEHGSVVELRQRADAWHKELMATQAEVRHYQAESRRFQAEVVAARLELDHAWLEVERHRQNAERHERAAREMAASRAVRLAQRARAVARWVYRATGLRAARRLLGRAARPRLVIARLVGLPASPAARSAD